MPYRIVAVSAVLLLFSMAGHSAEDAGANCGPDRNIECGWWWKAKDNKDEEKEEKKLPPPLPLPNAAKPKAEQELDCTDPKQWIAPCGFVDPGTSFAFQSKQRDALKERMVMEPSNREAVLGFQNYNQWMVRKAVAVANMWQFNLVQDPSLNPEVQMPVSPFGLKLLRREEAKVKKSVYQMIEESGGYLVWFTRSDCIYCHEMAGIMQMLAKSTKIPIYNASLDDSCIKGYVGDMCLTAPGTHEPAGLLSVKVVPDLVLHIPGENTWIRIATGVVTEDVILSRIDLFVAAVQAAHENSVVNSGHDFAPSVDFENKAKILENMGLGTGILND